MTGCAAGTTARGQAGPGVAGSAAAGSPASTGGDETSAAPVPEPAASTVDARADTHGVQRCHTRDLTGHVEGHGAGAGQRYAALGLTNSTAAACTIYGYPGLQLVDAHGAARQTNAHWDRSAGPTRLVVAPGQTVWAPLHWTVTPADDEVANDCAPDTAGLRVIPPDETTQLSMAFDAGRLCQHGDIIAGAFGRDRPADG